MCVTALGKVLQVSGKLARVEIAGEVQEVRIDLVPVRAGDYVYCAAGMAIEKAEAQA
ncbi:MAG: HypC/HybG/HupF family hydrogenase formation chaperone [Candidatus Aenigmarchaeota archaeon]|nr:HypC/HybG/HupF family hydrogenase formation chaperone [Candidatus Aenigmarchaeota archaeon]